MNAYILKSNLGYLVKEMVCNFGGHGCHGGVRVGGEGLQPRPNFLVHVVAREKRAVPRGELRKNCKRGKRSLNGTIKIINRT